MDAHARHALTQLTPSLVSAIAHGIARALCAEDRADRIARRVLRAHRALDDDGRALVAAAIIGTSGLALSCAWRLGTDEASPHTLAMDARALFAAWLTGVRGVDPESAARVTGLGDDVARALRAHAGRPWPDDPIARVVVEHAMPRPIVARLARAMPIEEVAALSAALSVPGPLTVRANPVATTRDALSDALTARGARVRAGLHAPLAVVFEARHDVDNCPLARAGHYAVQDEGSQLIAHALAPFSRGRVLDLCAGRGGKTLALVEAALAAGGHVVAADVDARALSQAKGRVRRHAPAAPCSFVALTGDEETDLRALRAEGPFDAVLVDAPCSQTGALRRGPDLRHRVTDARVDENAATARALLARALGLVVPGGHVVYATCSVLPDENDAVIDDAIARGLAVKAPLALPATVMDDDGTRAHLWPHVHGTDGFFIAALRANDVRALE